MLAELHCHTHYSHGKKVTTEGINSPEECIDFAAKKGLNALAITDHDEIKGAIKAVKYAKAKHENFLIIPGIEVSTQEGHVLALGIEEKIKRDKTIEETIDEIKALGGITIAPHPFDIKNEGLKDKSKKCDALEEFNAFNLDRISNFVSKSFAKKYDLVTTAGSDAHCKEMIGTCVNKINAETEIDSVLKAIKNGEISVHKKKYISISLMQEWTIKRLKSSEEDVIDYMDAHYRRPKKYVGKKMLKLVHKSPGKIDYFFDFLTYASLSFAVPYSAIINLPKLRYLF